MLLRLGVAIYVDKTSLTKNVLADKLEEILNNPRYTENIRRLKRKLDLYPFQPDELFVKWSEYSAEFGTFPETTLHGANMNFFTYFSLDVIIPCIFLVFVVSCIILKLFVVITRKIRSRKTKIE
ncbi:hypothetical protein AB6A40_007516 [Gnathostoma spinigerum]|uniref:glucuronosyltransferase n=1 Tax=Gnathostoma spinigerum TaxID=75299 RepID=A0ABD6EVU7_9BILA